MTKMNIRNQISQNKWKSYLIMGLFIIFVATLAYVFAKATGASALGYAGFALIFAGFSSLTSYFFADKMVIATTGARKIKKEEYPEYYRIVENLCLADGLPMPQVYVLDDPAPNAFATGRDPKHGVVCATTGILRILNKAELEGVIAHELSHIKNFDTRLMAIVAILVGFIALFADFFMRSMWFGGLNRDNDNDSRMNAIFLVVGIVLAVLSPIAASLIQLAVSRKREFLADASGALLTRYPEGLASALEKLAADNQPVRTASNATAHLFIENPFNKKDTGAWFASLFNTHPPMEERIRILRSM
jgi:heat shock protein HtpX